MVMSWWQPSLLLLAVALAVGLRFHPRLRGFQFTAWILVALVAGMGYPSQLLSIGKFDLRHPWLILIVVQLVMFGMGTQMRLADFKGVAKMPRAVGIGLLGQFTIMPLVGFALIHLFRFEPEIAAGVILIGSCSAGLSSNVMAFLARANLALSITMTAVSTMLAPLLTPLWMKLLAGELVEVDAFKMMLTIIKIVLVPIGAAMVHDYLRSPSMRGRRVLGTVSVGAVLWLGFLASGGWELLNESLPPSMLPWIGVFGFLLGAVLAGMGVSSGDPALAGS